MSTLSSNIQAAILEIASDVKKLFTSANKTKVFTDRSAFLAYASLTTPEVGTKARVNDAKVGTVEFVYTGSGDHFVETALQGWSPVSPVYLEHFGVVTAASKGAGGDPVYTANVQAACDYTIGKLHITGWVNINDKIVVPNRCTLYVEGGRTAGGFSVYYNGGSRAFNLNATCVIQPGTSETACTIDALGIWFQQPSDPKRPGTAGSKPELIQYPPAINIGAPEGEGVVPTGYPGIVAGDPSTYRALARGYIKELCIENAWDGIIGIGNMGGYRMGIIEVGATNRAVDLWGALDFLHIDSIHVWQFGMNSNIANIMYDGNTVGFRAKHMDGMAIDKLSVFKCKVELGMSGRTSILPMSINVLNLDGDKAVLRYFGESTKIGLLYSTKSASESEAAYQDVICSGGIHQITSVKATSNADGTILCNGGDLHVDDYEVRIVHPGRRAGISQGSGYLSFGVVRPRSDSARTNHAFSQQVNSSMHIGQIAPLDEGEPAVPYVRFESDEPRNYVNSPNYEIVHPTQSTQGTYIGKNTSSYGAHFTRLRKSGAGEGPELRFELSAGNDENPTPPSNNSVIGDLSWGVWDGGAFNTAGLLRGRLNSVNAGGNTPMTVQYILEDVAGNLAPTLELSGDQIDLLKPVYARDYFEFTPDGPASDDIKFKVRQFRPSVTLEDKSSNSTDWQLHSDAGNFTLRYGDASLGTKLDNVAISATSAGRVGVSSGQLGVGANAGGNLDNRNAAIALGDSDTGIAQNGDGVLELWANNTPRISMYSGQSAVKIHDSLELLPQGSEGGELRFQDAAGNNDFYIDVDGSNNLRIRQGSKIVFQISASGILSTPGILEYSGNSAAASGGVPLGGYYVNTSTGALTKRRS